MVISSPCLIDNKELTSPEQTAPGSAGFHQIIDFITRSHICYALTKKPEVLDGDISSWDDQLELPLFYTKRSLLNWRLMGCYDSDMLTFKKIFSNMKRITKGFSRQEVTLFPNMLAVPTPLASPSNSISSHEPTPTQSSPTQPSPQPSPIQPTLHTITTQHGLRLTSSYTPMITLHGVHSHGRWLLLKKTKKTYSSCYTKLYLLRSRRKRRRQGKLEVQYKGLESKGHLEVTPTEVIQEGSEKVSDEVSTAGLKKGLVSEEVPTVSTAEATLSTARGGDCLDSGEEEMERAQWMQAESTKKIDWNDPSVIRYHSLKMKPKSIAQARRNMIKYLKNQGNYKINDFKGMSYNDIRPIFEKVWDFNQNIVPMDAEKGSKKQKSPEKERSTEKLVEEEVVTQEEREEVVKEPATKRKKSIPKKITRKRQKLEEDPSQCRKIPICYDDDNDDYSFAIQEYLKKISSAITHNLPKSDSLIMEDKHLDTILEPESDELIKSSVEDLVHTPSESDDDFETVIDFDNDYSLSDDDSPCSKDIDYVNALPPDPELVSLEVVGNVVQEDGEIDTDILLTIKDDILREKLLKVNLLIAKIEALKDNPTPSFDFVTKSPSTSSNFFLEETNTFDNSLP
ncbi:hypothetical protein Tco_0012677 [Tanacetum coccineum]